MRHSLLLSFFARGKEPGLLVQRQVHRDKRRAEISQKSREALPIICRFFSRGKEPGLLVQRQVHRDERRAEAQRGRAAGGNHQADPPQAPEDSATRSQGIAKKLIFYILWTRDF